MSASTLNADPPQVKKMTDKETCECWIEEQKEFDDNHLRWWPCLGCGTKYDWGLFQRKGRYSDRYYEYRSEPEWY